MLTRVERAEALMLGYRLDLMLGDPAWAPHPVRAFGWLARRLEAVWRPAGETFGLRKAGAGFTASAMAVAAVVVAATLRLAPGAQGRLAAATYWAYALLAVRDLDKHASAVVDALEDRDLPRARQLLSRIVGRDTGELDEAEILRAVIETVAENLSDGIVAPLFYFAIGGPEGMAIYKAANTLDSMVGHRNERYLEFGWASARLDDCLNFVPARLTAGLITALSPLLEHGPRTTAVTIYRDAGRQPSPNAGYPEAAVAGALGVQLGGVNFYDGAPAPKELLGEARRPLSPETYRQCRGLLYTVTAVAVGLAIWVIRK